MDLLRAPIVVVGTLGLALAAGPVSVAAAQPVDRPGLSTRPITRQVLSSVSFSDPKRGWVVGGMDLLKRTTDGGQHWTRQKLGWLPTGSAYTDVEATGRKTGWVIGDPGIYRTENAGKTWKRVGRRLHPQPVYGGNWDQAAFVNAKRGWVMSDGGDVIFTANGGKTWSRQRTANSLTQFGPTTIVALDRRHALIGMNATGGHYLLGVGFGSSTWRVLTEIPFWYWNPDIVGVGASNPNTFWIGARTGEVFRSGNTGHTWQPLQPDPQPGAFFGTDLVATGRAVIITGSDASGRGAARTTVNGSTWRQSRMPAGRVLPLGAPDMVSALKGFAVSGGSVLRTVDGGQSWQRP